MHSIASARRTVLRRRGAAPARQHTTLIRCCSAAWSRDGPNVLFVATTPAALDIQRRRVLIQPGAPFSPKPAVGSLFNRPGGSGSVPIDRTTCRGGVMATSLYDLSVANYLQTLSGVTNVLTEDSTHFQANNVDLNEIDRDATAPRHVSTALSDPSGCASLPGSDRRSEKRRVSTTATASRARLSAGLQKLGRRCPRCIAAWTPAEVNAFGGKDVTFQMGSFRAAVHRRAVYSVLLVAELLFPRDDRVRHPAHEGRAHRQARLHGADASEELKRPRHLSFVTGWRAVWYATRWRPKRISHSLPSSWATTPVRFSPHLSASSAASRGENGSYEARRVRSSEWRRTSTRREKSLSSEAR